MIIGVFDSGVGGLSVARAIRRSLPGAKVLFVNDKDNLPYGTKSREELLTQVLPILKKMSRKCDVIVVACNTISTNLIETLRYHIAAPLIAMEPMVKPAAKATQSNVIAVCATPTTLGSKRYRFLKEKYAPSIRVLEPDCSDWANMIQSKAVDHKKIHDRITEVCEQGADAIVLGCTHYHWIEKDIQKIADEFGAQVIQPEQAVIAQLKRVLARL